MDLSEFAKKEEIRNFFESIVCQASREYSEEAFETAVDTMYKLFIRAEDMSKAAAAAYLTMCLGLYMMESFESAIAADVHLVTGVKPRNK